MDPVETIVMALASGAASGISEQVVKELYSELKSLIAKKYKKVHTSLIEDDPYSEKYRAVVEEDLKKVNAGEDNELLKITQALLKEIKNQAPELPRAVGYKLEDTEVGLLELNEIFVSEGIAADIKRSRIDEIKTEKLRIGEESSKQSPKRTHR